MKQLMRCDCWLYGSRVLNAGTRVRLRLTLWHMCESSRWTQNISEISVYTLSTNMHFLVILVSSLYYFQKSRTGDNMIMDTEFLKTVLTKRGLNRGVSSLAENNNTTTSYKHNLIIQFMMPYIQYPLSLNYMFEWMDVWTDERMDKTIERYKYIYNNIER